MTTDAERLPNAATEDGTREALEELMGAEAEAPLDPAEPEYRDEEEGSASEGGPQETSVAPLGLSPRQRQKVLRVLLLLNLALMVLVLVLPSGHRDPAAPSRTPRTGTQQVAAPRRADVMPHDDLWQQSVRLAGRGDFARAVTALQRFEQSHAEMADAERRLVYNQLSYYLVKDGRLDQAMAYERKSSQLMARSHLPEDLLRGAERAQKEGDLAEMRSAYARFLLQQKQVPPSLRRRIAEAYLKLGDSYRDAAERRDGPSHRPPAATRHRQGAGK